VQSNTYSNVVSIWYVLPCLCLNVLLLMMWLCVCVMQGIPALFNCGRQQSFPSITHSSIQQPYQGINSSSSRACRRSAIATWRPCCTTAAANATGALLTGSSP
jgi:hypothetical protein